MTTPNRLGQQVMIESLPVTLASDQPAIAVTLPGTIDVSDRAGRQLGIVSITGQPISVTTQEPISVDDNGGSLTVDTPQLPAALVGGRLDISIGASPATVPISAAALPLPAGAATEATLATRLAEATFTGRLPAAAAMADNEANPTLTKIAAYLMALDPAGTWDRLVGNATSGLRTNMERVTLVQAGNPAANTALTLTLAAAGAGLFHYITHIYIARVATAALAGGAILEITTTNLNGVRWATNNQASITVAPSSPQIVTDADFVHPLRSAVSNTATTIVMPAPGAAVSWRAWCAYYTGP